MTVRDPLTVDEDFYIPVRPVGSGSWVVSPEQQADDEAYCRKRLFEALKVPKEFLGPER